jgi:hypothetical protein
MVIGAFLAAWALERILRAVASHVIRDDDEA